MNNTQSLSNTQNNTNKYLIGAIVVLSMIFLGLLGFVGFRTVFADGVTANVGQTTPATQDILNKNPELNDLKYFNEVNIAWSDSLIDQQILGFYRISDKTIFLDQDLLLEERYDFDENRLKATVTHEFVHFLDNNKDLKIEDFLGLVNETDNEMLQMEVLTDYTAIKILEELEGQEQGVFNYAYLSDSKKYELDQNQELNDYLSNYISDIVTK